MHFFGEGWKFHYDIISFFMVGQSIIFSSTKVGVYKVLSVLTVNCYFYYSFFFFFLITIQHYLIESTDMSQAKDMDITPLLRCF